jgi:protein TonB
MKTVLLLTAVLALTGACSSNPPGETEDFQAFDTPPVIEKSFEPEYPEYAKQHQIEGRVLLKVTVGPRGNVEDARVAESTDRMFDAPALAAIRQFHFKPASKDGEPVRATVMVPVQFRL